MIAPLRRPRIKPGRDVVDARRVRLRASGEATVVCAFTAP